MRTQVSATHTILAATTFLPWKGLSCEVMSSWSLDMYKQTYRWWLNVNLSSTLEEKPSLMIWLLNFSIGDCDVFSYYLKNGYSKCMFCFPRILANSVHSSHIALCGQ